MTLARRHLVTATLAAAATALPVLRAYAAAVPNGYAPRGMIGRLERLPRLDLEARDDLSTDFRTWVNGGLNRAASDRAKAIIAARGLAPTADLPLAEAVALFQDDPVIAASLHTWKNCQMLMWRDLFAACYADEDRLLSELAEADGAGPGTLELNPGLAIPDYARHEIHMQPGGYVGDAFAGHVYHYGTNNFYIGRNHQDGMHAAYAAAVPMPADGKVRRILDMGTGIGQLAVALKQRFPEAEVWGVEVGAPMARYAHMRAAGLGADVNFAQRLAEDTKFPDGHFDIVASYILFHEVSHPACRAIMAEAFRVTRPGGVFFPMEVKMVRPQAPRTAYGRFRNWFTQEGINERWYLDYMDTDYTAEIARAGFIARDDGPPAEKFAKGNVMGTRPV
ncbi:MAG: class I SAM-dependent methyltransferase [Rhodospirillaceae bacterium]|nr:class I SAM-dependent methyltransferase [Rhodospirillaceae bacterium]